MAFASPIRHRAVAIDKGTGLIGGIILRAAAIRLNRLLPARDTREESHAPLVVADIAWRARGRKAGGLEARQHRCFVVAGEACRAAQLQVIRENDADQSDGRGKEKSVARAEA